MSDQSHRRTYDVQIVAQTLAQLHEYVTRCNGRIEITRPGSEQRCVLMSKEELDCLERALEILSDTDGVRDICGKIAQLAAATTDASACLPA
jgi:PHD/YefM family antitoxin component YafN of YafNO toxin-antitoxin module